MDIKYAASSNQYLNIKFKELNRKHFNDELDKAIEVKWNNRLTVCAGLCRFSRNKRTDRAFNFSIHLASKPFSGVNFDKPEIISTLIHEMTHVYCLTKYGVKQGNGHGYYFLNKMEEITGTRSDHVFAKIKRPDPKHVAEFYCKNHGYLGFKPRLPRTKTFICRKCNTALTVKKVDFKLSVEYISR